jgi:hypothetical protein
VTARRVEAEWLDTLPPGDARAAASRRDLARLNGLMSNRRMMVEALRPHLPRRARIAELGGGDGRFSLKTLGRLAVIDGIKGHVTLVDRTPCVDPVVPQALAHVGWTFESAAVDVFEWLQDPKGAEYDAIFANLFLHHFDESALKRLLHLAARLASHEKR